MLVFLGVFQLNLPVADATQLLVALAIIIFSILGSLLQSRQEAKKRQERMERPRGRGRGPDTIEEMLRESSRPTPSRPQKRPSPPKPPPVVEAEVVETSIAEHVTQTFQTTMARGEPVAGEPGSLAREKRAERKAARRPRLETHPEIPGTVKEGLPELVEPTATANQISSEVTSSDLMATSASPVMEGLANMLNSPEGLATAIVLKEILDRPEARWH